MSKAINVQSGHYKVAGRGRQGEGLLQEEQKRAYAGQRESVRRNDNQEHAGVPVWEATPPNLEVETTPASAPAKRSRKKTIAKAPAKKTAKRTAAARRKPTMPRKKAMRRRTSRRRATS